MSGHSKWSQIKRQKGVADVKRGQTFTKMANAITIATREGGGGDPASNFKLRLAIDQAHAANMPKENIQRAIDRGLGKGGGAGQLESVVYEGYGPGKVALVIEATTDNKNRTTSEVKNLIERLTVLLFLRGLFPGCLETRDKLLSQKRVRVWMWSLTWQPRPELRMLKRPGTRFLSIQSHMKSKA